MKTFIQTHCLTKSGGLNNRIMLDSWWVNRGFENQLNQILKETQFLEQANLSQRCWHIVNDIYIRPECVVCAKTTNFKNFSSGYYRTCSHKCSTQDPSRNTKISKNHNHASHIKAKENLLKKHGVEYVFQLDSVKEKSRNTKLEKYGSETYNNQTKIKQTNIERYGNSTYLASNIGQSLLAEKRKNHGGSFKLSSERAAQLNDKEFLEKLNEIMSIADMAEMLGISYSGIGKKFIEFGIIPNRFPSKYTQLQGKLFSEIEALGVNPVFNDRKKLYPKELDIYIPEKNLAIELNGIYWHSYNESETASEKNKHLDKLEKCLEKNIRLIQITDHEYQNKHDIVMGIIKNALGITDKTIRASKCDIKHVSIQDERNFLNNNHIQGYSASSIKLGLYHENELIYIMTFGKPRFNSKYDFELIRAAAKLGYKIHGAASKVFKYFLENHHGTVISYCDRMKFNGNTYEKLGFRLFRVSSPSYTYYKGDQIISRYSAQKKNLEKILKDFSSAKTESENMFDNGFRRYWDAGTLVYVLDHAHAKP